MSKKPSAKKMIFSRQLSRASPVMVIMLMSLMMLGLTKILSHLLAV